MRANWIGEFASLFLNSEESAALLTWEGDVLHAKSDLLFEITGFKPMVENSLKYTQPKPGDVLLANDPYSGGSFLYRYSFLMPLATPDVNTPGLVLCVRRTFGPSLSVADKLDDEGLRIPPTPILQKSQLVTPIIEAMSMHPLCPTDFGGWLKEVTNELTLFYQKWLRVEKAYKASFSHAEIKKFIQFSQKRTSEKVFEKAQGDARVEMRLDSGETLKLHLEIHDGRIKADFGGTTSGLKTFVPDYATFGSCYAAICDFYELAEFKTTGTFSILQVIKPAGCFLNAKFPASTYRGFEIGTRIVYQAMILALHQIVKSTQTLWHEDLVKMEFAFSNEARWLSEWSAKKVCESLSVEGTEQRFPIQFKRLEKMAEPAGFVVEFEVRAACQWRWLSDLTLHPVRAPKGWKTPQPHRLEIRNDASEEWVSMKSSGTADLAPTTLVRLQFTSAFEPVVKKS